MSPVIVGIVVAYLVICLIIGMRAGSGAGEDATGYVAGDRSIGLLVMYFITGATIFSAFAFLGAPGWAYQKGSAVLYILCYGVLGFIPFYFLGPRAARLGRKYGFVTQAEMVATRFGSESPSGRGLAMVMAIVSTVAFVPYLALQMKGAGIVLNIVTDGQVSTAVGAALTYGVVLLYVLRSGVLGVGWTNTFQGLFMMAIAWGLGLYLPYVLYGGVGPMFDRLAVERPELLAAPGLTSAGTPWNWAEFSAAVIKSVIGFSVWPHLFMRAFSSKDTRTLKRTVVLYPTFQLFLIPLILIGFAGVLFGQTPKEPDQILPFMLVKMDLPSVVVGLFCAGALAASMSSGDAMAHTSASILVRDGYISAMRGKLGAQAERKWIRVVVVFIVVAAYVFHWYWQDSLVQLLLYAYDVVIQFAPGVIATLTLRKVTGAGVLTGLLAGCAVNVALLMPSTLWSDWFALSETGADSIGQLKPFAGLIGLCVNTSLLALVSALGKGTSTADEHSRSFLEVAAGAETPN